MHMKRISTFAILFFALISLLEAQAFTCGDTLIDTRDGQRYATVLIGTDCWFKQNLNYGTYVPSDTLGVIHSQQTNNSIPEKYAQNNDTNNLGTYGGLYEQNELMNYNPSPQGLCPAGWHVSTDAEWQSAIAAAGGSFTNDSSGQGGNALKALGEGFGAGTGTDAIGLSLRHGGDRDGFGIFYGLGLRAIYWTSTAAGPGQAYHYTLWAEKDTIERLQLGIVTTGFSCRCVKDNATGTDAESLKGMIQLYPNPASEVVQVRSVTFAGQLSVYNSLGQCVHRGMEVKPGSTTPLEIKGWQAGLYVVQLLDGKGQLRGVERLVVR